MITFKENVRFKVLSPSLTWMITCLHQLDQNRPVCSPEELTITSVNDSVHTENSKHYKNEAIDIRSHNFSALINKKTFLHLFENMLNTHPALPNRFVILLEDEGKANEHFHVQVKKGMIFDWV